MNTYCPVCQSFVGEWKMKKSYRECPSCGSYSVIHAPTKKIIVEGLNNWAHMMFQKQNVHSLPSKSIYQRVNTLIRLRLVGKKLLDVGCGKIDFLLAAKYAGFRVAGMDIAEPIIHQLQRYAIRAYRSLSEIQHNTFDVVTCFDVIEHTTNPKDLLLEIRKILKKNGTLLFSTPNASALSARLLGESWWVFGPDGHYVLFTPKGLRIFLENNGFSVVDMKTNTLTQWIQTRSTVINIIGNKIIYCLLFVFLPLIYTSKLGDNIDILAKKK
jgi:2-polyprenyl-3-methyl-5-hydroxy-6-metoxy-1,4-benzoquinol methylase